MAEPARLVHQVVAVTGVLGLLSGALTGDVPLPCLGPALLSYLLAAAGRTGRQRWGLPTGCWLTVVGLSAYGGWLLADLGDRDLERWGVGVGIVAVQLLQVFWWRSRRQLESGLVLAVGLLTLVTLSSPGDAAATVAVAGWATAILAGGLLAAGALWAEVDGVAAGGVPTWTRSVSAAGLAIGGAVVAFLLLPLVHGSNPSSPDLGVPWHPAPRAAALSGTQVDTSTRGALSDQLLAEVRRDSPLLWRGRTFTTWNGRSWTTPGYTVHAAAGPPYVLGNGSRPTRADGLLPLSNDPQLWAPSADIRQVELPGTLQVGDDLALSVAGKPASYVVTTGVAETRPEVLRAAGVQRDESLVQLPPALPARVGDLARQITAAAPTPYDKVRAVESYLRNHEAYTLASPVPAAGEDAVDQFLFVDHEGFCEQFASAEVVLLRSVGVPARFVTGLAYGTDMGVDLRTYSEQDLHAWVEVPFDGVGWLSSDPTAGAPLAADQDPTGPPLVAVPGPGASAAAGVPAAQTSAGAPGLVTAPSATVAPPQRPVASSPAAVGPTAQTPGVPPGATAPATAASVSAARSRRAPEPPAGSRGRLTVVLIGFLALAMISAVLGVSAHTRRRRVRPVVASIGRGRRRSAARAGDAVQVTRPALAAFLRLDRRLADRRRRPPESLAELRDRLALGEELAAAFTVVEQECYGVGSPPADEAVRALDGYQPVPPSR